MSPDERPPLLLLPGIRGDAAEFDRLAPLLRGWRVCVATYPSPADGGPRSLAEIATHVLDAAPTVAPVDVLGASFGGLVAWAMPPDRVRSLTTIGTAPLPSPRTRRAGLVAAAMRVTPERLYREVYGRRARSALREDGADADATDAAVIPHRRALAARLDAIASWGLSAKPPTPCTWLWGATDRFVTWSGDDARRIGATPVIVPGGHRPHVSHPSEVVRWLPAPP